MTGRAPQPESARAGCAWAAEPLSRTLFGKPLRWSRGWTIVIVVWAAAGALLFAGRLHMGQLTAWSGPEAAAVEAVRRYEPDGVHRCDEVLDAVAGDLARWKGGIRSIRWYAFERPWEGRVYVVWEWGGEAALTFVVQQGDVRPDAATALVLETAARALAPR